MAVASDPASVPPLWDGFRGDPEAGNTPHSRAVRIIDLLDEDVDLSPARHVSTTSTEVETDFRRAREDLVSALDRLRDGLPDLVVPPEPRELPMTTVGELARAGVVVIAQAPLKMTVEDGEVPVWTVKDVTSGRPPSGRTIVQAGLVMLEPGDVVAPALAKDMPARVVADAGTALGPRLLSFRVDPERLDPDFLAGFLRVAGSSGGARTTTGLSRTDARRIPIPLLPLEEQRGYGVALRGLVEFQDALRACERRGDDLVRLGVQGLVGGLLIPEA